jgi:CRISPR-associated protein Csm3
MQFSKKLIISGKITALTGIAVGGSNTAMGIGGVDKAVIRNPVNNEPYIPGSTLKGKMRSLLELRDGTLGDERMGVVTAGPTTSRRTRSARLFGNAVKGQNEEQRPSRIVVRDAYLDREQVKNDYFKNTDLPFTEIKTEVVIDRITSRAMPRQIERVPAGAKFDFEMVLNLFDEDNETELVKDLFAAMQLVQNDYIGAAGSRGSGQIKFESEGMKVALRTQNFYHLDEEEQNVTANYQQYFPK